MLTLSPDACQGRDANPPSLDLGKPRCASEGVWDEKGNLGMKGLRDKGNVAALATVA